MPEGPEIHRAAAELRDAIGGKRAREVFFAFDHLKRFQEELSGVRVRRVEARGKAILTRFSNGLTVFSHNQLYGKWFVCDAGVYPATTRKLRFAVHTRSRSALLYSASHIEVLRDDALEAQPYLARLGPDLLNERVSLEDIVARLEEERFARRQLGHLLLDQEFFAGVGNYLRSEILYAAGLHPAARPGDLSRQEQKRLARTALGLSRRSYRTGGITNDAKRVMSSKKAKKPRAEYRFLVFARAGKPCYQCRKNIVETSVGSRRLYLCPGCQPRRSFTAISGGSRASRADYGDGPSSHKIPR